MRTVQVPKHQLRLMAMIAYREGEISEERCCEIAGIKRTELRDEMLKRCGMHRPFTELSEEVEQLRNRVELLTHQIITCGVAAGHPDPNLSRTGVYAREWDSPQAEQVRELRDDVQQLRTAIGLMTRAKPDMVMRPDDPVGMAQQIVDRVENLESELRTTKALVVRDRDDRIITQAAANILMDYYDQHRSICAENRRLIEQIEAWQRMVGESIRVWVEPRELIDMDDYGLLVFPGKTSDSDQEYHLVPVRPVPTEESPRD